MTVHRPGNDGRSATAIRFPTELHRRLRVAADERGLSINWLVNRAVTEFLDWLLPVGEIVLTRPPAPLTPVPGMPQRPAPDHRCVSDYVLGGTDRKPPARPPTAVTLREACETGVVAVSFDVARWSRAGGDPCFPDPIGRNGQAELFDPRDLQRWEHDRATAPTT